MSKKGIEDLKKEYEKISMSDAQLEAFQTSIEKAKSANRKSNTFRIWKNVGSVAAAVLITFIVLPNTSAGVAHAMERIPLLGNVVKVVTFRDYNYDNGTQIADVNVPLLVVEENDDTDGSIITADAKEEGAHAYDGETALTDQLKESAKEINQDIDSLTEQIINEFEEMVRNETGVKEVKVSHEVVATTERYFTLKLTHYEAAADGVENIYYYTIDLYSGERLELADLFIKDADYIAVISTEIKRQMREQMSQDSNKIYWLDEEMDEWNFKEITEDTQFYINERNQIVFSFNEGDVAPMYMGVVTFEIPEDTLRDIRKK